MTFEIRGYHRSAEIEKVEEVTFIIYGIDDDACGAVAYVHGRLEILGDALAYG